MKFSSCFRNSGAHDRDRTGEPHPYQGCALPTELRGHNISRNLKLYITRLTSKYIFATGCVDLLNERAIKGNASESIKLRRSTAPYSFAIFIYLTKILKDINATTGKAHLVKLFRDFFNGAGNGIRTRDPQLGRLTL